MTEHELTKTLDFDLHIESGDTSILDDATSKARKAYNQTLHYHFNTNKTYEQIENTVNNDVNLIKNTVQRLVAKTYTAIDNYYEKDKCNRPRQREKRLLPITVKS